MNHTEVGNQETFNEVRAYLRANAPQVKTFTIDFIFTGAITVTERVDKGKEGYDEVERTFSNFEELKAFYGKSVSEQLEDIVEDAREGLKSSGGGIKKAVAKFLSKATDSE